MSAPSAPPTISRQDFDVHNATLVNAHLAALYIAMRLGSSVPVDPTLKDPRIQAAAGELAALMDALAPRSSLEVMYSGYGYPTLATGGPPAPPAVQPVVPAPKP